MGIRQSDVPPEVWAALNRIADLASSDKDKIADPTHETDESLPLVLPCFRPPGCFVVAFASKSESNLRDWKKRSARTQGARKAVSHIFSRHLADVAVYATHYHLGGSLRATFTRLGARKMDRSNLASACKGLEDSVCLFLGADDGDSRWHPVFEQQPSGELGVVVELECI